MGGGSSREGHQSSASKGHRELLMPCRRCLNTSLLLALFHTRVVGFEVSGGGGSPLLKDRVLAPLLQDET